MSGKHSAGKGSRYRRVDPHKYAENYERIFGMKKKSREDKYEVLVQRTVTSVVKISPTLVDSPMADPAATTLDHVKAFADELNWTEGEPEYEVVSVRCLDAAEDHDGPMAD